MNRFYLIKTRPIELSDFEIFRRNKGAKPSKKTKEKEAATFITDIKKAAKVRTEPRAELDKTASYFTLKPKNAAEQREAEKMIYFARLPYWGYTDDKGEMAANKEAIQIAKALWRQRTREKIRRSRWKGKPRGQPPPKDFFTEWF